MLPNGRIVGQSYQFMSHTKEKPEKQNVLLGAFKKLGFFFMVALLAVNTFQLAHFGGLVEKVDSYNKGVVEELGGIRSDVMTFATDLNEMRSFLLLPTKEYSVLKTENNTEESESSEENNTQTATAIYSFLGKLENEKMSAENAKKALDTAQNIMASENLKKELTANSLTTGAIEENEKTASFKIINNGVPLFAVLVDKQTANLSVQSVLGPQPLTASNVEDFSTKIIEYVKTNKTKVEDLKKVIDAAKSDILVSVKQPEWVSTLTSRKITFQEIPEETETSINYSFTNADQEKLLTLKILRANGQIEMNGKTYATIKELSAEFQQQLQSVDTSSSQEKMVKQRKAELEAVFKEAAFQDLLKKNEYVVDAQPRSDYNKLLYDVKDKQGKVIFSFVIEISSGTYKVLKDNAEIDLFSAMEDDGSKKKP